MRTLEELRRLETGLYRFRKVMLNLNDSIINTVTQLDTQLADINNDIGRLDKDRPIDPDADPDAD